MNRLLRHSISWVLIASFAIFFTQLNFRSRSDHPISEEIFWQFESSPQVLWLGTEDLRRLLRGQNFLNITESRLKWPPGTEVLLVRGHHRDPQYVGRGIVQQKEQGSTQEIKIHHLVLESPGLRAPLCEAPCLRIATSEDFLKSRFREILDQRQDAEIQRWSPWPCEQGSPGCRPAETPPLLLTSSPRTRQPSTEPKPTRPFIWSYVEAPAAFRTPLSYAAPVGIEVIHAEQARNSGGQNVLKIQLLESPTDTRLNGFTAIDALDGAQLRQMRKLAQEKGMAVVAAGPHSGSRSTVEFLQRLQRAGVHPLSWFRGGAAEERLAQELEEKVSTP